MKYTTIERVKNKLRTVRGDKVSFSTTPAKINASNNNKYIISIGLVEGAINVSDEFQGKIKVKIEFQNPTEFKVYKTYEGGRDFREMYVGDSDINSDFSDPSGDFSIFSGFLIGSAVAGDCLTLDFDVDYNEAQVLEKIEYSEIIVDSYLRSLGFTDIVSNSVLVLASTYISAYTIWVDAFIDVSCDEGCNPCVEKWKKQAMELLKQYVDSFFPGDGYSFYIFICFCY